MTSRKSADSWPEKFPVSPRDAKADPAGKHGGRYWTRTNDPLRVKQVL